MRRVLTRTNTSILRPRLVIARQSFAPVDYAFHPGSRLERNRLVIFRQTLVANSAGVQESRQTQARQTKLAIENGQDLREVIVVEHPVLGHEMLDGLRRAIAKRYSGRDRCRAVYFTNLDQRIVWVSRSLSEAVMLGYRIRSARHFFLALCAASIIGLMLGT